MEIRRERRMRIRDRGRGVPNRMNNKCKGPKTGGESVYSRSVAVVGYAGCYKNSSSRTGVVA